MAKAEARVIQLQRDLMRFGMFNALRALNWMIETMNANNGYARKDGSNYYYHLVDATQDLLNHGIRDEITIISCILHDAEEDIEGEVNGVTVKEYILEVYGKEVSRVVGLVTKKKGIDYKDEHGVNITAYLKDILDDWRACLVKLADRKHNFSTLDATSAKHEARQVFETERYFIPFAKQARKLYPEHSAYCHSFKTNIMPHLKRIKKAIMTEARMQSEIEKLKEENERLKGMIANG